MPPNTTVEARAYPRPLPNSEWLGKRAEEILEPDLPIVDPHHHLWDHPGSRYLLDELLADVGSGHNIVSTVFIQCGSGYRTSGPEEMRPIGESEFVRTIAEEGDRSKSEGMQHGVTKTEQGVKHPEPEDRRNDIGDQIGCENHGTQRHGTP